MTGKVPLSASILESIHVEGRKKNFFLGGGGKLKCLGVEWGGGGGGGAHPLHWIEPWLEKPAGCLMLSHLIY